jgi:hypothetical protein
MAKIKLERDTIVVYYSEVIGGLYDSVKNYKIDLTNRKHFLLKNDDIVEEIEWCFKKNEESIMIENLKKEVWFRVENCYNVIHGYKQSGNLSQIEKHENHLSKNKIILEFLKNYKIDGITDF